MAVLLPSLTPEALAERLTPFAAEPLPPATVAALHVHYEELRRWAPRLALIGPGTAQEVLERHFGESLAALPFLPPLGGRLVDVGSGAGFPGLVLAAARPQWQVTLVEARERKWAFLQTVARRAALSCRCLNARVDALLPAGVPESFEALTVRALRLPPATSSALAERVVPSGRMLFWAGEESPSLPPGWCVTREVPLPAARARRLVVAERLPR
jgi:16S rRNA (guanine527-N7)-methyltransferase